MAELHLWMQAWSDQGERILERVERVGKVDQPTLAEDCAEADFRTFETALYQVFTQDNNKRTTEDGSTSTGSERIRSLARVCQ